MPQDEILVAASVQHQHFETQPIADWPDRRGAGLDVGATSGFDPLERLRTTFGLDRLSVGSDSYRQSDAGGGTIPRARASMSGRQTECYGQRDAGDGADRSHQGSEAGNHGRFRATLRDRQHQQRGRGECWDDLSIRILIAGRGRVYQGTGNSRLRPPGDPIDAPLVIGGPELAERAGRFRGQCRAERRRRGARRLRRHRPGSGERRRNKVAITPFGQERSWISWLRA